jgi:hypothetical protein
LHLFRLISCLSVIEPRASAFLFRPREPDADEESPTAEDRAPAALSRSG